LLNIHSSYHPVPLSTADKDHHKKGHIGDEWFGSFVVEFRPNKAKQRVPTLGLAISLQGKYPSVKKVGCSLLGIRAWLPHAANHGCNPSIRNDQPLLALRCCSGWSSQGVERDIAGLEQPIHALSL
jgi:hypothetical protein